MRTRDPITGLRVHLRVRIEVLIPKRTLYAERCIVLELIRPNIRVVMRQAHSRRKGPLVVSEVEIPVVRSLPEQCRVVGAPKSDGGRNLPL
jgi:hypothetical protein